MLILGILILVLSLAALAFGIDEYEKPTRF
jgi:hypothetical protein